MEASVKARIARLAVIYSKARGLRGVLKPIFPGLFRLTEGLGVNDTAMVLVQVLRDRPHLPLLEALSQLIYELDLGRISDSWTGHRYEAIRGVLCEQKQDRPSQLVSRIHQRVPAH